METLLQWEKWFFIVKHLEQCVSTNDDNPRNVCDCAALRWQCGLYEWSHSWYFVRNCSGQRTVICSDKILIMWIPVTRTAKFLSIQTNGGLLNISFGQFPWECESLWWTKWKIENPDKTWKHEGVARIILFTHFTMSLTLYTTENAIIRMWNNSRAMKCTLFWKIVSHFHFVLTCCKKLGSGWQPHNESFCLRLKPNRMM